MKKILIFWPLWLGLIVSMIIWIALEPASHPTPDRTTGYNVIVIAGCEYIEWNHSSYFLIHKANCTNSIHGHE